MFYILRNLFLLQSYEFRNIKNNSLFLVEKNLSVYPHGIRLAQ